LKYKKLPKHLDSEKNWFELSETGKLKLDKIEIELKGFRNLSDFESLIVKKGKEIQQ